MKKENLNNIKMVKFISFLGKEKDDIINLTLFT